MAGQSKQVNENILTPGDRKNSRVIEGALWIGFVCLISVIAYFHEPWLDEAQAWMIAKEASVWEIFFKIPHTEGHPPLWYLILLPFAKGGVSYEWGIKVIAIVISALSAGILLFCAPFARGIRYLLPFTYFFFYQYGVISRPYGLMLLALVLAACTWKKKDEKPWLFVLSLALLCLSSAYGIVFAGGICIVWLLQIWNRQSLGKFCGDFVRDPRCYALLFLLILAVCLILEIMPGEDTYTGAKYYENGMLFKFLFLFLAMPVEALFGQCLTSYASIGNVQYNLPAFGIELVLGILFWVLLIWYGRKKGTLLLLLLPVGLFDVFGILVYFFIHHIGLLFEYLIFWYWISQQQKREGEQGTESSFWKSLEEKDRLLLQKLGAAVPYLFLLISVGWNLSASVMEIRENYGYAIGTVEFLREHDLLEGDHRILAEWKSGKEADGKTYYEDSDCRPITVAMLPYLSEQERQCLVQCVEKPYYNTNVPADEERNKYNYDLWASQGVPDVVIGSCELEEVYNGRVSMNDYTPVAEVPTDFIWKNIVTRQYLFLYLRTELAEELELVPLMEQEGNHYLNNSIPVPSEQE